MAFAKIIFDPVIFLAECNNEIMVEREICRWKARRSRGIIQGSTDFFIPVKAYGQWLCNSPGLS